MVSKFNSLFWTEHGWLFERQYQREKFGDIFTFYSINPYR